MLEDLRKRVENRKVLLLGIGNRLRGDDGVGSLLAERLHQKICIPLIDASDVPENYLSPMEDSGADLVLIVDAVDFEGQPGELALIELDQLQDLGVTTHSASLSLLFEAIPPEKRPEALLIAVQPESTETSSNLTQVVSRSMDGLERLFLELFRNR